MTEEKQLTSTKPYLLCAFYHWITDNKCSPFIVVNAEMPQVTVPEQYIEDGRIILNISPSAVEKLQLPSKSNKQVIAFDATFEGTEWSVHIPILAVLAIYAQENGRGMVFIEEKGDEQSEPTPQPHTQQALPTTEKPKFKLVSSNSKLKK
ncbi:MAG: ClpXP protease specificity-enhancing factor [Gammaproteobacteria bacterium]|nr:ClpXP protease specificity-enhancing factor [Gammaproteobacteria bacterium]